MLKKYFKTHLKKKFKKTRDFWFEKKVGSEITETVKLNPPSQSAVSLRNSQSSAVCLLRWSLSLSRIHTSLASHARTPPTCESQRHSQPFSEPKLSLPRRTNPSNNLSLSLSLSLISFLNFYCFDFEIELQFYLMCLVAWNIRTQ